MKTKLYFISGLGADERMFQRLDLSEFEPIYVQWITPVNNEPISDYAFRLVEQISDPNPIIIGLSFGGILAVEISKHILVNKVILISSAAVKSEIPLYNRLAGQLNLHKLVPSFLLKKSSFFVNWLFDAKSVADKILLEKVLRESDSHFVRWAINALLKWKNEAIPNNIVRIHGTNDHLLPCNFTVSNHYIKNGGHLMVLNRAPEVSRILQKILTEKI